MYNYVFYFQLTTHCVITLITVIIDTWIIFEIKKIYLAV